jgi:rhamnose transport system permease protein
MTTKSETTRSNTTSRQSRTGRFGWDKGIVILLLLTLLVGSRLAPEFLTRDNVGFVLQDIGEIFLLALPMTLLIIAGEIDLSVASALTLSSAVLGRLFHAGLPASICVLGALLTGTTCGLVNGLLVTKLGLQSLAVTIGTLGLFRGLCYVLLGNEPVNDFPSSWTDLGALPIPHTFFPWSFIPMVVSGIAFAVLLHSTRFGRWAFAIGTNKDAARFSGIPVARTRLLLFVSTGFMAGMSGIVYSLRFASASPGGASGFELSVIAATLFGGVAIAGGIGTIWGVATSVFMLGAIRSLLQLLDVSANVLLIASGALLLLSVTVPRLLEIIRQGISSSRVIHKPRSTQ